MKRTLALFLTLCMALSMFSFPAFAAEADVAVLDEAALVETETTPAPTEDVTAPAAAATYTKVVASAAEVKVDYDGAVKSANKPTVSIVGGAAIPESAYKVEPAAGETNKYTNAGAYGVKWNVTLLDDAYTFATDDKVSQLTAEVLTDLTIKPATVTTVATVALERKSIAETPVMKDVTLSADVNGEVVQYLNAHKELFTFTQNDASGHLVATAKGNDLSAFAGKTGNVTVTVNVPADASKNWAATVTVANGGTVTLPGNAVAEAPATSWGTYKYKANALAETELKKGVTYDGKAADVTTIKVLTKDEYTAAMAAAGDDTAEQKTQLAAAGTAVTGTTVQDKAPGMYYLYVEANNGGTKEGWACAPITIEKYTAAELAAMLAVDKTTLAAAPTGKAPQLVTDNAVKTKLNVKGSALEIPVVYNYSPKTSSDPDLASVTTVPNKPGNYVLKLIIAEKKDGEVVLYDGVSKDFDYTLAKESFTYKPVDAQTMTVDSTGAGDDFATRVAALIKFDQAGDVKDGNGTDLTKTTDFTVEVTGYYDPSGIKIEGTAKLNKVGKWIAKVALKPVDANKDFYAEASFDVVYNVTPGANDKLSIVEGQDSNNQDIAFPTTAEYGSTAAAADQFAKAAAAMSIEYAGTKLTSGYTVKWTYTAAGKDPVTIDGPALKDAGTYTMTVSYDPKDGSAVATDSKSVVVTQKELKTLRFLNPSMEYTDVTPANPTITEDDLFVSDLAVGDSKADLYKDMTFEWDGTVDTTTPGTAKVKGTLKSVNYKVGADNVIKGTVTVTGKMDTTILVSGDTEVTYDGKGHTLTATLSGGAATDSKSEATAVVTYVNEKNETVAAPTNVGVYTATATMLDGGKHNAQPVVKTITINAATPTVEFKDLGETKDHTVAYKGEAQFKNYTAANNVTLKGVPGETGMTASLVKLYWADAEGNQLYNAKDADGNDIVTTDEKATGAVKLTADKGITFPGEYYLTAQYIVVDEKGKFVAGAQDADKNYLNSAAISEKFVVEAKEATLDNVAPYATALKDSAESGNVEHNVVYGDKLEGATLFELNARGSNTTGKLLGTYVIANATGKANKVGTLTVQVKFIPKDAGYKEIVLPGTTTINVGPATLEQDVNFVINNTEVSYDGKDHYLGEAAGEGVTLNGLPFESDAGKLTVEYSANGTSGWTKDASSIKFNTKGGHYVFVRITDASGNFNNFAGRGLVDIGVVAATLKVEDKTVTYSWAKNPEMKVSLVDKDGKVLAEVPSSAYTVGFHAYTEVPNAMSFDSKTNAQLHVTEKPYWAKVTLTNGEYAGYAVSKDYAYATYTVTPATLGEKQLTNYVKNTTASVTGTYNGTSTVNDVLTQAIINGLLENTKDPKEVMAGSWDAKDGGKVMEVKPTYTLYYKLTNTGDNAPKQGDFVEVTKDITVKGFLPAEVTVNQEVVVDPEKAAYGITIGELKLVDKATGKSDFTFTSTPAVKGTLAFNDPADMVIPVSEKNAATQLKLVFIPTNGNPANFRLVNDDRVDLTVGVIIEKAEPVITVTNTTMAYTGNPASLKVESTNTETEPKLTWYDAKGNTIAGAPTQIGKYKVKVSLPETKSFKAGSVTVDYEITYNQTGIEGFVYRLYAVALGREPDQNGYTMWVNLLKAKEYTPKQVADGFIFSPEFTNRKYDNATFLNVMYKTFMDREPDADGYAMWLKGLNSGEYTREFVFNGFADSKEFTNICKRYGL